MTTSTAKHRAAKAAKARARHKEYERERHEERSQIGKRSYRRYVTANNAYLASGLWPVKWHPFAAGVTRH